MNKQKSSKKQQEMTQAQNSVMNAGNATNAMDATNNTNAKAQSLTAKQQASKAEYGTLTAKEDANNDYE